MRTLKLWPLSVAEIKSGPVSHLVDWAMQKNPTYHFVDSGIACALRRFTDATFAIDNTPQALGGLLESFFAGELQRAFPLQDSDYRLYHWRSTEQREIDILIDGGNHLVNIELKSSASVAPQAAPDKAVIGAEAWVVSRDGYLPVEGFRIPLRLGMAEVFDAVQADVDQVPFASRVSSIFVTKQALLPCFFTGGL
jgi:hypothetical protein